MRTPTRGEVLEAARAELRPGIGPELALLIGWSAAAGQRLDPEERDGAATLLRAQRLMLGGTGLGEAITTARAELAAWRSTS